MRIEGIYKFKKAILVNEELLRSLELGLCNFAEEYAYTAKLESGNDIYFDNLEELLEYDNYSNRRIKHLTIRLSLGFYIEFSKSFSLYNSYNNTVNVQYLCSNSEDSIIIQDKLRDIFEKGKLPWYYTLLTKFSIMYFWTIYFMWSAFWNLRNFGKEIPTEGYKLIGIMNIICIVIAVIIGVSYVLNKMRNVLFPPIVFYFGKEKERFDKNIKYADKVFWGIIIATLLSLIIK